MIEEDMELNPPTAAFGSCASRTGERALLARMDYPDLPAVLFDEAGEERPTSRGVELIVAV